MRRSRAIEARRRSIQIELDAKRPARDRNRAGQFATPPPLASAITHAVLRLWGDRGRVRFLEPALGTGSFYAALLEVFGEDRVAAALGVERDPELARTAQMLWSAEGLRVDCGDFLGAAPPPPGQRFNLILANPPYVRHHHLDRTDKARLRARTGALGHAVSGLASLYVYFVLLADCWLEPGGLACWLLPSEFLDVNYGAALRRYLTRDVSLRAIHRFDPVDRQFGDALVTSSVVVYERRPPATTDPPVLLSMGGTLAHPRIQTRMASSALASCARWSALASGSTAREGRRERPGRVALGELFDVRRGVATGANRFFVLPRSEARARGIPDDVLRPILPAPRRLSSNVVEAGADGYPELETPLALIDCRLEEHVVRERWPALWAYLEQGRARGLHLGYLARRRRPWYAQERRDPPAFVCTYMGRSVPERGQRPFRFLWNRSRAVAGNVYLLLYPRGALRTALEREPAACARVHAALEAIEADALVRCGRVYGGGLFKLEPRELAALPLAAGAVLPGWEGERTWDSESGT